MKIRNKDAYPLKSTPILSDYVIGSDDDTLKKVTKNFQLSDLRELFVEGLSPEVGGTLKFTEIEYNGALTSPAAVANTLATPQIITRYEFLLLSVNGNKHVLKLQDLTIGFGEDGIADSDFMTIIAVTKLGTGINVLKGYNVATGAQEFYGLKSTGLDIVIVSGDVVIEKKAGLNLGAGQVVYKGLNATTKIDEYYTISSTGLDITLTSGDIAINKKAGLNLGNGQVIYKGLNAATKIDEYYTLASDDFNVTLLNNVVKINNPATASVPRFYVNSTYTPVYPDTMGDGTLARPFTDTRVYDANGNVLSVTPNTSIQNGSNSYLGTASGGTRLLPHRRGEKMVIQNNNSSYIYNGDFNYSDINVLFEASVTSTLSGKVLDMDNASFFDQGSAYSVVATFEIAEGKNLYINGLGFFNSGNSVATNNYGFFRKVMFNGKGEISCIQNTNINNSLFNSDPTSSLMNNNDGHFAMEINCNVFSTYQGIYKVGGNSRVDFINCTVTSGDLINFVDENLRAFHQTGGLVRIFDCKFSASGKNPFPSAFANRKSAFTLNAATLNAYEYPLLLARNTSFIGHAISWFTRVGQAASLDIVQCSSLNFGSDSLFTSPSNVAKWEVNFKNNIFEFTEVDFAVVDFTQGQTVSALNTIGNAVIESLIRANDRTAAELFLPKGGKFINTGGVASPTTNWKIDIVM